MSGWAEKVRRCGEFPEASCCISCHEDEGYGYGLLEYGSPKVHTYVCCGVDQWAEDKGIDLEADPE